MSLPVHLCFFKNLLFFNFSFDNNEIEHFYESNVLNCGVLHIDIIL